MTNILSTPGLLALDKQEVLIQMGTDIPVITGKVAPAQAVGGQTTGIIRSMQYHDTRVIPRVRPTIFADDKLQSEMT